MTALCSGGPSAARIGFGSSVAIGAPAVGAAFNNVPTPLAMAVAGYLGLINYELSTYCTADPPPLPTLNSGDWAAVLTVSDPVAHFAAVQKFQDYLANMFWPIFCQCTTTTTPAAPGPPTPPADVPNYNPPQLAPGPQAGGCWTKQGEASGTNLAPSATADISASFLPVGDPVTGLTGGTRSNAYLLPPTATTETQTITYTSASGLTIDIYFGCWDSNKTHLAELHVWARGPATVGPQTFSFPANTAYVVMYVQNTGSVTIPAWDISGTIQLNCTNTPPGSIQQPCCPPDPSVQAMLQTITALVQSIYQSLPTPIGSYAESTVHAGLSGNGSFLIGTSTIAVKVSLTTIPPSVGVAAGDPQPLFGAGFITPIAAEAPLAGARILYSDQVVPLPRITEQVGYTLPSGVVATITELTAGP